MSALLTVVLLPEQRRFAGAPLSENTARLMARADTLSKAEPGYQAQLQRYFYSEDELPVASALVYALDDACYVRAEPAFVRAEMGVMRLMAYGAQLELTDDESLALASDLSNNFGQGEWQFSVDALSGWFFRSENPDFLPKFAWPDDLLGADIFPAFQLKETRFWNALSVEAQIILHNSVVNQRRILNGRLPVNALLFWGAGSRKTTIFSSVKSVQTDESALRCLHQEADKKQAHIETLIDMRHVRDFDSVFRQSIQASIEQKKSVRLDFADGSQLDLNHTQRFKVWRRRWTFDA
jgi:hypothetical protein